MSIKTIGLYGGFLADVVVLLVRRYSSRASSRGLLDAVRMTRKNTRQKAQPRVHLKVRQPRRPVDRRPTRNQRPNRASHPAAPGAPYAAAPSAEGVKEAVAEAGAPVEKHCPECMKACAEEERTASSFGAAVCRPGSGEIDPPTRCQDLGRHEPNRGGRIDAPSWPTRRKTDNMIPVLAPPAPSGSASDAGGMASAAAPGDGSEGAAFVDLLSLVIATAAAPCASASPPLNVAAPDRAESPRGGRARAAGEKSKNARLCRRRTNTLVALQILMAAMTSPPPDGAVPFPRGQPPVTKPEASPAWPGR